MNLLNAPSIWDHIGVSFLFNWASEAPISSLRREIADWYTQYHTEKNKVKRNREAAVNKSWALVFIHPAQIKWTSRINTVPINWEQFEFVSAIGNWAQQRHGVHTWYRTWRNVSTPHAGQRYFWRGHKLQIWFFSVPGSCPWYWKTPEWHFIKKWTYYVWNLCGAFRFCIKTTSSYFCHYFARILNMSQSF